MKRSAILALIVAASAAMLACGNPGGRAGAATYYIDYDKGDDTRDGVSPGTSWRHAPGDPRAAARPARTALQPGDVVIFAEGVTYRGHIKLSARGAINHPITLRGGGPNAIIDGSDPIPFSPCRSPEDCGGASEWPRLVRASLPPGASEMGVFSDLRPLRPAQAPDPSDDFYMDEREDMFEVDGMRMAEGRVEVPLEILRRLGSEPGALELALWVKPNRVVTRPVIAFEGNVARFDPKGLSFYTDRPASAAVRGSVRLIDRPGEYALIDQGRSVVAWLPSGATMLSIATGRGGIELRNAAQITVSNLTFQNMTDGGKWAPGGVSIYATGDLAQKIRVNDNTFRNMMLPKGQGAITMSRVRDVELERNRFEHIVLGSGIRVSGARISARGNEISRVGRTGIMFLDVNQGDISNNSIRDIRGVHGNGISVYLDSRDIRVAENTVIDAKQPVTFRGAGDKSTANNSITFENNLFVATPDALGALISWGGGMRKVTIRNNLLLGGRTGLRLNGLDTGVSITDNVVSGLIVAGQTGSDWVLAGNAWTELTFQQKKSGDSRATISESAILAGIAKGVVPKAVCDILSRSSAPTSSTKSPSPKVGASNRCP